MFVRAVQGVLARLRRLATTSSDSIQPFCSQPTSCFKAGNAHLWQQQHQFLIPSQHEPHQQDYGNAASTLPAEGRAHPPFHLSLSEDSGWGRAAEPVSTEALDADTSSSTAAVEVPVSQHLQLTATPSQLTQTNPSSPSHLTNPSHQLTQPTPQLTQTSPPSLHSSPTTATANSVSRGAAAASQCRHFNSNANASGSMRFSERIKACTTLNQLFMLWRQSGFEMRASHMALMSAQAVKLMQKGRFLSLSDFKARQITQRMLTSIAERIQLEACTIDELDMLLSSWARLTKSLVPDKSAWYPPEDVLRALVQRLREDPARASLALKAAPASRLDTITQRQPSPPLLQPHSSQPDNNSASLTSPSLSASQYSGNSSASLPSPSHSDSINPINSSLLHGDQSRELQKTENRHQSFRSSPPASSSLSTHASSSTTTQSPAMQHSEPSLHPVPSSLAVPPLSPASLRPKFGIKQDVMQSKGSFGDKLKTASCPTLASISSSLHKLNQLDSSLLHSIAQLTLKKAKHGSVADLGLLAHVLYWRGWRSREVYETIASVAETKMKGAPDPEDVTKLLKTLGKVDVRPHSLLRAVAEDAIARTAVYAPWAPRIASICAAAGFYHHQLFEALTLMALDMQDKLSLGLWGQLVSAFTSVGAPSPHLCAAACRATSVPIQHMLLQLDKAPVIAKTLGIKSSRSSLLKVVEHTEAADSLSQTTAVPALSSGKGAEPSQQQQQGMHLHRVSRTHHMQVFLALLESTQTLSPAFSERPKITRTEKRQIYWRKYEDTKQLKMQALGQTRTSEGLSRSAWLQQRVNERQQQMQSKGAVMSKVGVGSLYQPPPHVLKLDLKNPVQALNTVHGLCGLLHGLGGMGHYDRELTTLACSALRELCASLPVPWHSNPSTSSSLSQQHQEALVQDVAGAVSACARLRHHDWPLVDIATEILMDLAAKSSPATLPLQHHASINLMSNSSSASEQMSASSSAQEPVSNSTAAWENNSNARSRTIFVGGLHREMGNAALLHHFEQFGEVEDAQVMYHTHTQNQWVHRSRGYGFVTFAEAQSVAEVLRKGGGHSIKGKQVEVKPALKPAMRSQVDAFSLVLGAFGARDQPAQHSQDSRMSSSSSSSSQQETEHRQDSSTSSSSSSSSSFNSLDAQHRPHNSANSSDSSSFSSQQLGTQHMQDSTTTSSSSLSSQLDTQHRHALLMVSLLHSLAYFKGPTLPALVMHQISSRKREEQLSLGKSEERNSGEWHRSEGSSSREESSRESSWSDDTNNSSSSRSEEWGVNRCSSSDDDRYGSGDGSRRKGASSWVNKWRGSESENSENTAAALPAHLQPTSLAAHSSSAHTAPPTAHLFPTATAHTQQHQRTAAFAYLKAQARSKASGWHNPSANGLTPPKSERQPLTEEEAEAQSAACYQVLQQVTQSLARAHTAFTPTELCDMLGALACSELCPWQELVYPALCKLADMCRLKPPARAGGPASVALDIVHALMHGGYGEDKLQTSQKVQLYQMFLVAQAAGRQDEFKEAVGSWDAIRDARAAWHAAQPAMPHAVIKALTTALEDLQLSQHMTKDFRTQDGSISMQIGVKDPDSGRMIAIQVMGPEECEAKMSIAALGPSRWRAQSLERRGISCVTISWYEYQLATHWRGAVEGRQALGFPVDAETSKLPRYLSRLDLLLERKIRSILRTPPVPPLVVT